MTTVTLLCIVVPIILIVLIYAVPAAQRRNAQRVFEENQRAARTAEQAYRAALRELRTQPASPEHKARALQLGRTYSNLTRNQSGVTVYDEMAIANDIAGATAGAAQAAPAAPASADAVSERLKRIDELRTKGIISDVEYAPSDSRSRTETYRARSSAKIWRSRLMMVSWLATSGAGAAHCISWPSGSM